MEKKNYILIENGECHSLLLSEDQAAIILWLKSIGIKIELVAPDEKPLEIRYEDWCRNLKSSTEYYAF